MASRPTSQYTRDFSRHLTAYMKDHSVTHSAVAAALDVARSFVSEHTNGKRAPDTDLIDAVARLAGETAYDVVRDIQSRMRGAASEAELADAAPAPHWSPVSAQDIAAGAVLPMQGGRRRPQRRSQQTSDTTEKHHR